MHLSASAHNRTRLPHGSNNRVMLLFQTKEGQEALICFRYGRRSWRPWLISLGVEASSAALIDAGESYAVQHEATSIHACISEVVYAQICSMALLVLRAVQVKAWLSLSWAHGV